MPNRTDPTRADYTGDGVRPDWPASYEHLMRPSAGHPYRKVKIVQQLVPLQQSSLEGTADSVPVDSSRCR